ncbi:DNA helicase [Schumannella sp. 10F1B-5-1]|uniref:DNA helicase n=1 Tax=Schumannella sp. 10F1B-5-1 TaxID=2590780 RepID=UPI001131FFF1|nr:DNA helicase [Schumannella sp. 10F1B-5-1]TPW76737.1 DNA helicase [Schumannella sp. 10F1B-5-1]
MASTRKRKRELKRLKNTAATVVDEQREVLDHAGKVLREARRQLGDYAKQDVAPRFAGAYESNIRPRVASGVAAGRAAAYVSRARIADDVIPAVAGTISSTLAVLEAAKDPRVREVVKKAGKKTKSYSKAASKQIRPAKSSGGPGKYILAAFGIAAVAAVAYAAWQTLRADDDLWIEDVADVDPAV